jgi:hypothetical protein
MRSEWTWTKGPPDAYSIAGIRRAIADRARRRGCAEPAPRPYSIAALRTAVAGTARDRRGKPPGSADKQVRC